MSCTQSTLSGVAKLLWDDSHTFFEECVLSSQEQPTWTPQLPPPTQLASACSKQHHHKNKYPPMQMLEKHSS